MAQQHLPGIAGQAERLRCPLCAKPMAPAGCSLQCASGHSFDLARSGYVNLLCGKTPPMYDKALFTARAALCRAGAFLPMTDAVADALRRYVPAGAQPCVLDAGCGEGTHLHHVLQTLHQAGHPWLGAGIDIAKEGVMMAAKAYPAPAWLVGDLAHSPFADGAFDAVLNILSPSNYAEFARIIRPGGVLVKVVPGPDYLLELREAFYADRDRRQYNNGRVISLFEAHFEPLMRLPIRYQAPVSPGTLSDWVSMTPLSRHVPPERIGRLLSRGMDKMTVDLLVLVGQSRLS